MTDVIPYGDQPDQFGELTLPDGSVRAIASGETNRGFLR